MGPTLRICEIFKSLQGETSYAGLPCGFVRTAGCNLDCSYCDTQYARADEGPILPVDEVARRLLAYGTRLACITGGEPLLQADGVVALAERLLDAGLTVLLETNGTLDLAPVPDGVVRVMDVKCPGSGEAGKTLPGNIERLTPRDEVKFVLCDRRDFDWAVRFVRQTDVQGRTNVLFSPAFDRLKADALAGWILESGVEARLQIQLHKILWPDRPRGA